MSVPSPTFPTYATELANAYLSEADLMQVDSLEQAVALFIAENDPAVVEGTRLELEWMIQAAKTDRDLEVLLGDINWNLNVPEESSRDTLRNIVQLLKAA